MAKRSKLKKEINFLIDHLLYHSLSKYETAPEEKRPELLKFMQEILETRRSLIARISHTEKRYSKRYFKQLNEDLLKHLDDFWGRFETAEPEAEK